MKQSRLRFFQIILSIFIISSLVFQGSPVSAAPGGTVLILSTSVLGGTSSVEYVQAVALGFTVELANASQWAAKTQADFSTYRAIILGDATCSTDASYIQAAIDNRTTWGPAINGNIMLIGGDPEYHANYGSTTVIAGATAEIKNSIGFVGDVPGKTGLYASFGCLYYLAPESGTVVNFLDQIGSFSVRGQNVDDVHIVASHPALEGLTDALLSNWGNSTHAGFTSFPSSFIPLAIMRNITGNGSLTFGDGSVGLPYMLARGEGLQAVGLNISMTGPATGNVGDNITYTITYGNSGNANATSLQITDPLPPGTAFVSATGGGLLSGGNIIWNLGTLNAGVTGQTVTLTVSLMAPGTITNENYTIAAAQVAPVTGSPVQTEASGTLPSPTALPPASAPIALPVTGFAPNQVSHLSPQQVMYAELGDLWLEIPRLGTQSPIVGVPQTKGIWDVSWLGDQAGWLNGSAYPTWSGNSVITGHVTNSSGNPGPFAKLSTLWWGDKVIIHVSGAQYIYEVRSVQQVGPGNTNALMKHEELPWVTLVTCRGYDAATNSYLYRILVRAALVQVK